MEFFDKLGKKASEAYKITADKTGKIAKETKLNSVNSYSFVRLSIAELEGQNKIKSKLDYVTKNYIYFSI